MGDDRWEVQESVENGRKEVGFVDEVWKFEVDGGKEWLERATVAVGWEKGLSSSSSSGVEWFRLQCTVLKRLGNFIFVRVRWKTRRILSVVLEIGGEIR